MLHDHGDGYNYFNHRGTAYLYFDYIDTNATYEYSKELSMTSPRVGWIAKPINFHSKAVDKILCPLNPELLSLQI
jgi:hypothetical protein